MIFSWIRQRRRRQILAQPISVAWREILQTNVAQFVFLSPAQQNKLCECVQIFVAERNWEGCNGLQITDEIRVTIAGYACLLLLEIEHDYFSHVLSVLVYPTDYRAPNRSNASGVVLESEDARHGEAQYRGPVILSWSQIEENIQYPWEGKQLVLHEFAHQLDMLDREINGVPLLSSAEFVERWQQIMTAEYTQLVQDVRHHRPTFIDPYGATNAAEFFAVTTECFFSLPWHLQTEHPELYHLLSEYYGQDPTTWKMPVDG